MIEEVCTKLEETRTSERKLLWALVESLIRQENLPYQETLPIPKEVFLGVYVF